MKVALVYDRVNKWGGAERLLLALREIFPNADLYSSVSNTNKAPWVNKFKNLKTSFISISKKVQKRLKKNYGRGSKIIYPPVTLRGPIQIEQKGKYFLIFSRLVSYKKTDIAKKACNKLKLPLKSLEQVRKDGF